ncbi:hypothetical protein [Salinibacter altiplanensis]|nr:hypothetical protein [Salinibacter altiplanensis]
MAVTSSPSATQTWDQKRLALALIAFVAGGAVPIQLVTLSFP